MNCTELEAQSLILHYEMNKFAILFVLLLSLLHFTHSLCPIDLDESLEFEGKFDLRTYLYKNLISIYFLYRKVHEEAAVCLGNS